MDSWLIPYLGVEVCCQPLGEIDCNGLGNRSRRAEVAIIPARNGLYVAHGGGKEHLVCPLGFLEAEVSLLYRAPLHDQLPGDAGQRAGAQRRCDDRVSEHQKDVAACPLADTT